MNNDDELWTRYISKEEDEQMILNGIIAEEREASHAEGVKEGLIQKEREMIINMLHKGLSIEDIKEISNLSEKEVKEIIEENKNIN